jgi:hypothetical protein
MPEVRITEALEIGVPPRTVFDYRLDFTTLSAYNPHVSNVRQTVGSEPGIGAEYVFDLSLPGAPEPMESPLRVLEADPPSNIVIDSGPNYMAREVCTFEPAGDGTLVTFQQTITFPGLVPQDALDAVAATSREQARLELELIRKILEG